MRKIVIHPDICNGQPTIEGTRITVSTVLEFLSAGDSIDEVLAGYPTLTRDDVLACLSYSKRPYRVPHSRLADLRQSPTFAKQVVVLEDDMQRK